MPGPLLVPIDLRKSDAVAFAVVAQELTGPNGSIYKAIAAGGGGTPGGANGSVQFNNSGAFGGFGSWDGSVNLTVPSHFVLGPDPNNSLQIGGGGGGHVIVRLSAQDTLAAYALFDGTGEKIGLEIGNSAQGFLETGVLTIQPAFDNTTSLGTASLRYKNLFLALPTADPHVVDQLWNNAGVVTVSAG